MGVHGLASRMIENARVQAFRRPILGFHGGVVVGDDPESARLRHTRGRRPRDRFDHDAQYGRRLDGIYGYVGLAHKHFGHVMAELIHRILPTRAAGIDGPWLVVGGASARTVTFSDLPGAVRAVYGFLGLTADNTVVVTENVIVERLFVSEAGSDFWGGPKPGYLELMAGHTARRLAELGVDCSPDGTRLYVSRSKVGATRSLLGETVLDRVLERAGFVVFHPQQHTLEQQVGAYARADSIMFLEGSAAHGTEFLGAGALRDVVLLNRRSDGEMFFGPVLRPRARRYTFFGDNHYLGSALVDLHGRPADQFGVSLLNLTAFAALMDAHYGVTLSAADRADYLAAAAADLAIYLDTTTDSNAHKVSAPAMAAIGQRFAAHTGVA